MLHRSLTLMILLLFSVEFLESTQVLAEDAPFLNRWLVLGPFDNDENNGGVSRPWIEETASRPTQGLSAGRETWTRFDDREFSRNFDDYQDLFSYFYLLRQSVSRASVAYAHVYAWVPHDQSAELRLGGDTDIYAWLNGEEVLRVGTGKWYRDAASSPITLRAGWNSLLLKVGCREQGRFGFYARLDEKESASFMANWITFAFAYPTRNADSNGHSTRDMVATIASIYLVAAV